MKNYFKVGPLSEWSPVENGELLEFDVQTKRTVKLSINASEKVFVMAGTKGGDPVLVAAAEGMFGVEFTLDGPGAVQIVSDSDDAVVFVRGAAPDQRVQATKGAKGYTDIAPRARRNTQVDRMMELMRINEVKRNEQYSQMMKRMEARGAPAPLVEIEKPVVPVEKPKEAEAGGVED